MLKVITSNKLQRVETVSQREAPQIKPHPEDHSQCSRRASVSTVLLHWPRQRIISCHYVAHPGFSYEKKRFTFQQNFSSTELLLQDLPLPLELLFMLAIFVFQKTGQSITPVGLKNWICTTFTFQGRHRRQPSSKARVTSHKLPASLQHLTDSRF